MKQITTWILVADGGQAQVYAHRSGERGLTAVEGLHFADRHLKAQDIMADRPGRSISSMGAGGRSAMEYSSDPVAVRERRFVEHLADELEKHRRDGAFDRLIIAAAPTALGDIRPALGKPLKEAVIAELPKDLTNVPPGQLAGHFAELLPV
jgi:protein required for attachment to host cells